MSGAENICQSGAWSSVYRLNYLADYNDIHDDDPQGRQDFDENALEDDQGVVQSFLVCEVPSVGHVAPAFCPIEQTMVPTGLSTNTKLTRWLRSVSVTWMLNMNQFGESSTKLSM